MWYFKVRVAFHTFSTLAYSLACLTSTERGEGVVLIEARLILVTSFYGIGSKKLFSLAKAKRLTGIGSGREWIDSAKATVSE